MNEAKLGLLEVQIIRRLAHTVEVRHPTFSVAPESLNTVDVRTAVGELVVDVVDAQVLGVADIDQAVLATPTVEVDDTLQADTPANRFN